MLKKKKFLISLILVVILVVFGGLTLLAAGEAEPGSSDDPLITLSYFAQEINTLKSELGQKITSLETELNNTKKELSEVKAELNKLKANSGNNTSGTTKPEPTKPDGTAATPPPTTTTPPASTVSEYGYVTASSLNVREGPGGTYKKIGTVYKNNKVSLLSKSGDWYKIKFGTLTGWVSASYIRK